MKPNPYLVASSCLLALPLIPYAMHDNYIGILVSFFCSFFSMLYHASKPRYPLLLTLDQVFGYSTVVYATAMTIKSYPTSIVPYSFLTGGAYTLYHLGFQYKIFVWHPDLTIATRWHMLLHLGNGVLISIIVFL